MEILIVLIIVVVLWFGWKASRGNKLAQVTIAGVDLPRRRVWTIRREGETQKVYMWRNSDSEYAIREVEQALGIYGSRDIPFSVGGWSGQGSVAILPDGNTNHWIIHLTPI